MSDEQQTRANADDPSGDGWRDVRPDEILQADDMAQWDHGWSRARVPGIIAGSYPRYRRRIEPQPEPDDPSGEGWRDVTTGGVTQDGDMVYAGDNFPLGRWVLAESGETVTDDDVVRRRIEPEQPKPQAINPDDPRGDGWRDLGLDEPIEQGDVYTPDGYNWLESDSIGRRPIEFPNRLEYPHLRYRRRIEQPQPSDSEPETVEDLRKRLDAAVRQNVELADRLANERRSKTAHQRIAKASVSRAQEAEALVAEAERGGQQVNAELQQLRKQVRRLQSDEIAAQQRFTQLVASQEHITAERDAMAAAYHNSCIKGEQVNAELQQLRKQVQTLHNLAEMSRRQVADEAGKVEQLKQQLHESQRTAQRYRNQLEGALEHAPKCPRNFRERMVLEKFRAFVEAQDDDPLTFGYVQLRATDPHVLGCSEFVVESWHQDVGGGGLSESVRVFLRHYASEEDQDSRKEISARTYFHVRTVGDYERLLSLLGIGGQTE